MRTTRRDLCYRKNLLSKIKSFRTGLFFALLVSIFLAVPGQTVFAQGTGSISGTVLANGSPLVGATVYASGPGSSSTTSATDGTYTITGLTAGSYTVIASDSVWATQYYNNATSAIDATAVTVTSGGTTPNINFNLVAGGTITGIVMANGSPLEGAMVSASGPGGRSTTSGADGTYTITGLTAGSYTVYASGSGWATQYYNLVVSPQSATAVTVTSGGTTPNINFNLVAGGTITGIVKGPGGALLANANVSASNTVGNGTGGSATSGADGTYTMTGLTAGSYTIRAGATGLVPQLFNHADYNTATAVTVTSGGTTSGINFDLVAGGTITGIVRGPGGSPLANAFVSTQSKAENAFTFASATSGADGTYTITGLTAGRYRVYASNYPSFPPQCYNHAYSDSTVTPVSVTSGETTSNINFNLEAGGTITGTVRGPGGTPVGKAIVSVVNASFNPLPRFHPYALFTTGFLAPTDANGTYTISGLPAGSYLVYLTPYSTSSLVGESSFQFYNNAYSSSTATAVAVANGGTTSNIDLDRVTVSGGGTIKGRITLSEGLPCQSCLVSIYDAASSSYMLYKVSGLLTSSDGSYESQPLPAGSYKVAVFKIPIQLDLSTEYFWPATTNIDDAFSVAVTAGAATPNINIEIGAFNFTDQTGVARSTVVTSNSIFAWWLNTDAIISITGGVYSLNGGAYTSASGMISPGNSVQVRQTSSPNYGTTTNATLTIGVTSDTFSVTTLASTPPVVTAPPTGGIQGTSITINGSNFGAVQGGSYVDFNGVHGTVSYWSDTQIVVIVPPGPTSGSMKVVTPYGASSNISFTVYPPECGAPIKVAGSNYYTIQDAYNHAATGSTMQITEGLFNTGNLEFNRAVSTRVTGGYDCGYSAKTGYSTVDGTITIKSGTVTVDGLIIK